MDLTPEQLKDIIKQALKESYPEEPKEMITIDEAVKISGIGRNKMLELVHSQNNDFPCFRVGTKFYINRNMLFDWLKRVSKEKRVI